jgi:hypothetical protein
MSANRFEGQLSSIDPHFLVTEHEKNNRVESFFLGLGVIFNDLQGLLLFQEMLEKIYEKPERTDISVHRAHCGGIVIQIQKLIASIIDEFFRFLEENNEVFSTIEFQEVFNRLRKNEKAFCTGMIAAANGELPKVEGFIKTLAQIRNTIAFHYDHSGKTLRGAFISRFFGETENAESELAYYSAGEDIVSTRFYFSDTAVEEAMYLAAGKIHKENVDIKNPSLEDYWKQMRETIDVMSSTVASLVENYIKIRRNRPH